MGTGRDLPRDPNETVEQIIGSVFCDASKMSPEVRRLTLRDVMTSAKSRYDHKDGAGNKLKTPEWDEIIAALSKKHPEWIYKGGGGESCCCSWG